MPVNYLSGIFGPSLLKPLQEHMDAVIACVSLLPELIHSLNEGDAAHASKLHEQVIEHEQRADELKIGLREHLSYSLLLPIPRRDLLEILQTQDKMANRARDLAGLVRRRELSFPEDLRDDYLRFLRCCVNSAVQAQSSIHELDELFETGFRGQVAEIMSRFLGNLDALESEADQLQSELEARVMRKESSLPPVDVMFLYRVLSWTGNLADYSNRIGNSLHLLVTR